MLKTNLKNWTDDKQRLGCEKHLGARKTVDSSVSKNSKGHDKHQVTEG